MKTKRAVAAIDLGSLVAAIVGTSAAASGALVGLLATLIDKSFAASALLFLEVLRKISNAAASIVLSETIIVLVLLSRV